MIVPVIATELDPVRCYEAIKARDSRFDGVFFVGVRSTGVYCRPVCRVRTPLARNCHFFASAASAERAGFRPCLRCRPELAPGHSPNDAVKRLAHRAAALIKAGTLQESNLNALACSLGVSDRQLRRAVEQAFGVSPIALAQTYRLLLAKQLLTETGLKIVDVAFASGFASLRRFNDAFRRHYRLSPSDLRKRDDAFSEDYIQLQLSYRPPLAWGPLMYFLSSRSSFGLTYTDGKQFAATLRAGTNTGWFLVNNEGEKNQLRVNISCSLLPNLSQVVAGLRQLFDLDAHPQIIDAQLSLHPRLKSLVQQLPGLRIPGTLNGFELAVRAILGQQISVKAATTMFGRFVDRFGESLVTPLPGLTRLSPTAESVAAAPIQHLLDLGLTQRRAQTIQHLARHVADGTLQLTPHHDRVSTQNLLLSIPGIGPWTVDYVAMRALADPDAIPCADLGLMKALGVDNPKQVLAAAEHWRPWRAYGAIHLWHSLKTGG